MQEEVLKTSIEALQKSYSQLLKEEEACATKTKGKLKETQHDVEKEAESKRKLARITVALSDLHKALADGKGSGEPDLAGLSRPERPPSYKSSGQSLALTAATPSSLDNEPVVNPFTGSYVYRETDFEPGPSAVYRDQKEQNETPMPFKSREDATNNRTEPTASFADSATIESKLEDQGEDEPTKTKHRTNNTIDDVKPSCPNAHQTGRYKLGYWAKVLGSWTSPNLRGFFFARNSSPKAAVHPVPDGQKQDQVVQDKVSSITASTPSTAFGHGNLSQESIMSVSTAPLSLRSLRSKCYSSAKDFQDLIYRHAFSSIDEGDNNDAVLFNDKRKDLLQIVSPSKASNTHPPTTVGAQPQPRQHKSQKMMNAREELKYEQPRKAPALSKPEPEDGGKQQQLTRSGGFKQLAYQPFENIGSQNWAVALSFEQEDLADHNQVALTHEPATELQLQEEDEVAHRQRQLDIERDCMEAIRLQEMFDEEAHRERQATLEYMKGLDEAAQWQEDEQILQAQRQAAMDFAQSLYEANKQADIEHAAQLRNERMVQRDREYARLVQAEMKNVAASENSLSSSFDESPLLDPWNIQRGPASLEEKVPLSISESQLVNRHPFQRLLSFRGAQNSVPLVAQSDTLIGKEYSIAPDTGPRVFQDRALALKLHEAERIRLAEEDAQWQKDLRALQRASKTWKGSDNASSKADGLGTKRERVGNAQKLEQAQTEVRKAKHTPQIQVPLQPNATQTARIAPAEDGADCGICGDSIPKTRLVRPCEHFYCRNCLTDWFHRALREKPKKRPRCCKRDVPVSIVAQQLGPDFLRRYEMFELEIATPHPLYCAARKCSAFVPPAKIHGDLGFCRCGARTCRHCLAQEHPGKLCAQDQETQKVEAMGKKKGWKHCPRCKHMIERTAGCLHMTCSQCRTEFCWKCLKTSCKGEGICRLKV